MLNKTISVALVEPLYPINIGYIARCMKNFGLKQLYIINPQCQINDEAYRYAMHGRDVLSKAIVIDRLVELKKSFDVLIATTGKLSKKKSPFRRVISPERMAKIIQEYENGKFLIIFGREDKGLLNKELGLCDIVVSIPANPEYSILNISHAAVILFYILFREISLKSPSYKKIPKREITDKFILYSKEIMNITKVPKYKIQRFEITLKRIIFEYGLDEKDLIVLLGLVRRAYDKLKQCLDKSYINSLGLSEV